MHNAQMDAQWFKSRKKALKLTDTAVGAAMGVERSVANKFVNGKGTINARRIDAVAKLFQVPRDELMFRAGVSIDGPEPSIATDQTIEGRRGEQVEVQEWDLAYGMGAGTFMDLPVTGRSHTFSREWLQNFTHAPPDKVFIARGAGDSMTPTILDTDMVIIDTSEREVRVGDKIWAVAYGTTGYIKRIRPMPDGSVKMLSDNQSVPPETAYDGELSVVGRVVAIIRKC